MQGENSKRYNRYLFKICFTFFLNLQSNITVFYSLPVSYNKKYNFYFMIRILNKIQ